MTLVIANERLNLTLEPAFGARVTTLTNVVTGRQWLVDGPLCGQTGDDAVYGARHARGWDECFPTVAGCTHPAWGPLRDHGVLWGRRWEVIQASPQRVETRYSAASFDFTRVLTLDDATVTAAYCVANTGQEELPFLWSQHCLLATTPDDAIALSGMGEMQAGGVPFEWPRHPDRDLTKIGSCEERLALKSYATTPGTAAAAIVNPAGGIRFDWDDVPAFGLWLSYCGWPRENPVHQVALEPTSAAADGLDGAEAIGQVRPLLPQETRRWSVRVTLTGPEKRIN